MTEIVRLALEEDIGTGDVTSSACVPETRMAAGRFLAREPLILSGVGAAVFATAAGVLLWKGYQQPPKRHVWIAPSGGGMVGWVDVEQVISVLAARPGDQHVVITGRDADARLIGCADVVTEMTKVKHPMDAGQKGQKGIEW